MILECPACQNRYLVDPRAIGEKGRSVRCAKCKHQWFAAPPTEEQARTAESAVESEQKARAIPKGSSVPAVKTPKTVTPLALKLASIAIFFLLLVSSAIYFQPLITHYAPKVQPLYNMIGMYDTKGIVLAELAYNKEERVIPSKKEAKGGEEVEDAISDIHKLQGYVVNTSDEAKQVPVLQFSFFDKNQNLLKRPRMTEEAELLPGEQREFSREIELSHGSADKIVIEIGNPIELGLR